MRRGIEGRSPDAIRPISLRLVSVVGLGALMVMRCGSSASEGGAGGSAGRDAAVIDLGGAGGTGGIGTGGDTGIGTGGRASGGSGSGGIGTGGDTGIGTGGWASGGSGSGGIGTGGVLAADAGCSGDGCGKDAGASDVPAMPCTDLSEQSQCDGRSDCHSVFVDPGTCGCASPGCCARFQQCAAGALADCSGPALCEVLTPNCESPYVVSYANDCYEGCVRQTSCASPTCPAAAPSQGAACGSLTLSCLYQDCDGAGRSYAKCSGGVWSVQTSACTPMLCTLGEPCAVGQVCLTQTTLGGVNTTMQMCASTTCGTGPVSQSCVSGARGTCTMGLSIDGASLVCTYNSCGQGQGGCM